MTEERRDISRDDRAAADDALVDALLAARFEQDSAREERIARAFATLDAAERPAQRPMSFPGANPRHRLLPLARAAMIVLALGALFLLFPYETSASGILDAALRAESSTKSASGSRRYEIRVVLPPRTETPRGPGFAPELVGTWDLRGDSARLDLVAGQHGATTRVSSPDAAWERTIDGTVRALDSRVLWPRWIEDPSGEVAVERMDALLRLVQRSYIAVAARTGDESPAELRGSMHVVATRNARVPGPDDIELWIDTGRNVVLAARLAWNQTPDARGGERLPRGPAPAEGRPPRDGKPPRDAVPPFADDYRPARGMLPPFPPRELHLRRVEPIEFPADHFAMPASR